MAVHNPQPDQTAIGFVRHTLQTAPEQSRATLAAVETGTGAAVPHLLAYMADSPPVLTGYVDLYQQFLSTGLAPDEQQLVLLTASVENECHYCVAGHTPAAREAGLSAADVSAVRDGRRLSNDKLEALRSFTQSLVISRGFIEPQAVQAFVAAGYSPVNVLEVVLGIAVKTLSNYTNHLIDTPLDPASLPHAWTPPSIRAAA